MENADRTEPGRREDKSKRESEGGEGAGGGERKDEGVDDGDGDTDGDEDGDGDGDGEEADGEEGLWPAGAGVTVRYRAADACWTRAADRTGSAGRGLR